MAMVHDSIPTSSGKLSGREVRRVVALILAAEAENRTIAPLSRMIPGLTIPDAYLVRDATVRARAADGDRIAALCADGSRGQLIVSERMLGGRDVHVDSDGEDLIIHAVIGSRVPLDAMRGAYEGEYAGPMRGELVLGMAVARRPFGDSIVEESDHIGVNGGMFRIALADLTPAGGEEFAVMRDRATLSVGRLPSEHHVWDAALASCVDALRTCSPFADRLMSAGSYLSHPLGELVFALPLGNPVVLPPGATAEFHVSGLGALTATSTVRFDPKTGGQE